MSGTRSFHWHQALPTYLGGKRKLLPWIFGRLAAVIPPQQWKNLVFADPFVGGGAVSLFAKRQGFQQVLSNDWSDRSQLIIQGLLSNQTIHLSREDVLYLTQALHTNPGFVELHFCPSVFSTRHAKALDSLILQAETFLCPTKQALAKLLVWHLVSEYVCFPTSIGTSNRPFAEVLDGLREWHSLNPKRFTDQSFPRLFKPTWNHLETKRNAINGGVTGGSPVQGFQMDAFGFVSKVQADILYLDPPYPNTSNYESHNRVLDAILSGHLPGNQPTVVSPFSKGTQALEDLLACSSHIPCWILSYGSNVISLQELVELVKRHAGTRTVEGYAKAYQHLAHVSKQKNNQEFLVVAYSGGD